MKASIIVKEKDNINPAVGVDFKYEDGSSFEEIFEQGIDAAGKSDIKEFHVIHIELVGETHYIELAQDVDGVVGNVHEIKK